MLQVKSFKISDGEKISELLKQFPITEGGEIITSNGEVMIPFDDGKEPSINHRIIAEKKMRNLEQKKVDLMVHSQRVLEIQEIGIKKQIEEAGGKISVTPKGKKDYDANKEAEKEVKRLENVLAQNQNQILMNQAELTRMVTNIAVHNESIARLEAELAEAK